MDSWKKTKNRLADILKIVSSTSFIFLLVMPYSINYKLKDYGFGSGGTSNSTSGSYAVTGIAGDVGGGKETSSPYALGPGLMYDTQANVPTAPIFTNPSSYYNKLHIIINTASNPTDTKYAIAISPDSFTTTYYVKSDDTVGTTLAITDYQTYAAWGNSTGVDIIGLNANTTYQVKVKAMQGKFTETGYGPIASVATVSPTLSFAITTDLTSIPPFSINFESMIPAAVNSSSPHQINVSLSTNGASGGRVYVSGGNGGLHSTIASYQINAVTSANLGGLSEGYGAQGISGGTLTLAAPYDTTAGDAVGIVDSNVRNIFYSAGPITGGTGSFLLKAKPASTAPAANDYAETLTVVASGSF